MIVYDEIDQGSDEWRELRRGVPTASEFSAILAKGEGKTRKAYMLRLASEILTGEVADTYESADMIRGREQEPEARDLYAFMEGHAPRRVAFIANHGAGCSPDSLIGDDGALEIKTRKPALQIELLLANRFPPEHRAQCQGVLWIAERDWIDLAVYSPKLPLFVTKVLRDEAYIKDLAAAVAQFNDELAETVERIRRIGGMAEAA